MLIRKYKKSFIALGVLLVTLGGLALAMPAILKLAGVNMLKAQGLEASIQDLRLGYLDGELEVASVEINAEDGAGLRLERLLVAIDYLALFEKRIHLRRLEITGAAIDVERLENNQVRVAGVALPAGGGDSTPAVWGFGLDAVNVQDSRLNYKDSVLEETLVIGASTVTDVATWLPGQSVNIESNARVKNGLLQLSGQVQPFGEKIILDLAVDSEGLPLDVFSPYIQQEIKGDLAAELQLTLTYTANESLQLSVKGKTQVDGVEAQLPDADVMTQTESIQWVGDLDLVLPDNATPEINITGDLDSRAMQVSQISTNTPLLALEQLQAEKLVVKGVEDIQLAAVRLGAGEALYLGQEPLPQVRWASATADQLTYRQAAGLHARALLVSGLQARAARSKEGEWNLLQALPVFPADDDESTTDSDQAAKLLIRIDRLASDADSQIYIEDASVSPVFKTELKDIQIVVTDLDSSTPDSPSPASLKANVGRYGKLNLDGQLSPFAESPGAELDGRLEAADLVPLGGYTGSLIGYGIKQGTVSSDISLNIGGGDIAANFDLVLNKLKVAGVKGKTGEFQGQMGMTLPAALKLMRDRDDNIRLSLPVSGSLDNPDFGVNEVIQKAIFKAVQMGVLTFYSPLGIVAVADGLFSLATALRFKPVEFEPGSYLLGQGAAAYLDEMAGLLLKRPEQQVTICGFASEADRQSIAENVAKQNVRFFGLFKPEPDASEIAEDELIELARKRVNLVGDYLVTRGMPAEQLIICEPEIDQDASAEGRVEVSL